MRENRSRFKTGLAICTPYNIHIIVYNIKLAIVLSRGDFIIDSILKHRGDRQRRSTMEFKVRWLDYAPKHVSCPHWTTDLLPETECDRWSRKDIDQTLPRLIKIKYLEMHDAFPFSFFSLMGLCLVKSRVLVSKSLTYSMDLRFVRSHRQKEEALCHTVNWRYRLYVHLNCITTM